MSTTIDQKVVEMRFDNKQFESATRESMSTLDKLKQSLNLTGASKGLENVNAAAGKVNLSGIGNAIETVHAKFSALEVMGVTALANITNSAVNAGKRMISALTIDPIKTGFQEYETQINAVQTILANTKSKGSTIDNVNSALDELNKYADLTIYNFTEMTRNIGTFTAAGIDLETSVSAIQGIANLAAVSGSTSQQASTAMYQLSQALATGTVKLMDWNSVVNAGMGGEVFQNALKKTSELLGTGAEEAIKTSGSFRESLKDGWLTAEVLTETLKKFTTSGANEYVAEYTGLSKEAVEAALKEAKAKYGEADAIEYASKALAEKSGKNADEIKDALDMANTAEDAATKVKTFTQLWDVMKEAVQSGWAQTWRLLFGDFEQAKDLFTPISEFATGIIEKFSNARNTLLEGALGKTFSGLVDKVKSVTDPIKKSADSIKDVVDSVKDYGKVVDEIIGGKWGNGKERWDELAKSGYDWAHAQNLVNEKLGSSVKHATDYSEAQKEVAESQNETSESTEKLTKLEKNRLLMLMTLDEEGMKSKNLTKEQIEALTELRETADKLGIPMEELINNLDEIDGRWILLHGLKNIGQSIVTLFKSIGEAWKDAFPPMTSDQLFNIIAGFHKLTSYMVISEETAGYLTRTFKGVFAVLGMVSDVLGGGFKIAFKAVTAILEYFDMDILQVTANIGDALVAFRKATDLTNLFGKAIEFVVPYIKLFIGYMKKIGSGLMELPGVEDFVDSIKSLFKAFKKIDFTNIDGFTFTYIAEAFLTAIDKLKQIDFKSVGKHIIQGLKNGIGDEAAGVISKIIEVAKSIITSFCSILHIASPSKVFIALGSFIVAGLLIGLKEGLITVPETIKSIASSIIDTVGKLDWGKIFAGGISIGTLVTIYKFADALQTLASPFEGLGDVFESVSGIIKASTKGVGKILKSFSKVLNSFAFSVNAKAIRNIAISLAIVMGALLLMAYVINKNENLYLDLWKSVFVIFALAVILGGLALAVGYLSKSAVSISPKDGVKLNGLTTGLISIAASLAIVALAIKMIGSLDKTQFDRGMLGLAGIITTIGLILLAFKNISQMTNGNNMSKFGSMLIKVSIAMLLMVGIVKILGSSDPRELAIGTMFITAFCGIIIGLMAATKLISGSKNIDTIGGALFKIAGAIAIMGLVARILGGSDPRELAIGTMFITAFCGILVGLMAATKLISGSKNVDTIGGALFKIAGAIAIMGLIVKLLGGMDSRELKQGTLAITAFCGILIGLMAATKLISGSKNVEKIGGALFKIAGAIAIMAIVVVMLSYISLKDLVKGTLIITAFAGIMIGLMAATKLITGSKNVDTIGKTLLSIAGAIAILAGVAVLLGLVPLENLIRGTAIVAVLAIIMGGLIAVTKLAQGCLGNIIALTIMMAALAGIVYLMSKIPLESAITSAVTLGSLALALSLSLALLSQIGKSVLNALKGVLALTAMAIPLLAFVGILYLMNNVANAIDNVKALTLLATACTLLLIPLTLIGGIMTSGIGALAVIAGILALTAMAIPMLAFVGVLALMNNIENATTNTMLLVTLMTVMTELLVKVALVAPLAVMGVAAMTGLVSLIAVIGVLAVGIGELMEKFPNIQKFLDSGLPVLEQLAESIGIMIGKFISGIGEGLGNTLIKLGNDIALFMLALSVASANASTIKSDSFDGVKELMKVMAEIAVTTAGTTIGDIFTLGGTSMEKFQADGVAFFKAMKAIGEASSNVNINKESIGSIIDVAISLVKLQSSLEPIGGVITWFTGRDDLGTFGFNASLFISSMKNAFSSLEGAKLNTEAMNSIIEAATGLATLQSSLEPIGGVISWFTGRDDLGTFGVNVGLFIASMRNALGSLDGVGINTEAVNAIITAATSLSTLQSSLEPIGGVISWFAGRDDLGTFGVNVGLFISSMKNAFSSLEGAKFNTEAMDSIIIAATGLSTLQSSLEPIGGVITWFVGRDDLGTFGTNASLFITSMKNAFSSLEGAKFNVEAMDSIIAAATGLAGIQPLLSSIGGVITWFVGRDDLGTFGTNASLFITSMKNAFSSLEGAKFNVEAMDSIVVAATKLASFQSTLEPMGGVISWFTGRDDLGTFGTNIGLFADAMGTLKTKMGEDGIPETVVSSVINAGNAVIELNKALPEESWFDGKMDLKQFSGYVTDFANAMATFGEKAAEIDSSAVSTVISTAYRIKNLINSLTNLDTSGLKEFTGVGTGGFGADGAAYKIAQAISAYSDKVSKIDTTAVSVSVSAALRLKSLIGSLVDLDTTGIDEFKPQTIGTAIKDYANKVAGIDITTLSTSISAAQRLKSFINSLAGLDTSGVSSFKTAISSLSSIDISGIANAFKNVSKFTSLGANMVNAIKNGIISKQDGLNATGINLANMLVNGIKSRSSSIIASMTTLMNNMLTTISSKREAFNSAGAMLMVKMASGMSSKSTSVKKAASSSASQAASGIRDYYDSFYSAGSYLVSGFVNGISENSYKAVAQSAAMASAAYEAAKSTLAINSPSKLFRSLGYSVPEGFAMGIDRMSNMVKSSSVSMADNAINTVKKSISHIADTVNTDIDSQPVIRPVLDLSDVESGAGAISGLFNNRQSVGVLANVGGISTMMNRKLQNGSNDELVSAINKLRGDLSNIGNNYYTVEGVTYSDGSEVSEAVSLLTRAIRMEGRV